MRGEYLDFKSARTNQQTTIDKEEAKISFSIIREVMKKKEAIIIDNVFIDNTSLSQAKSIIDLDIKAIMVIPIIEQDKSIGVLYLDNVFFQRNLYKEKLDIVKIIVNQTILSLQNVMLYANMENIVKERTEELQVRHKVINDNLLYAECIQKAILPSEDIIAKITNDYFLIWQEKDIVGGDFYWCYEIPKH